MKTRYIVTYDIADAERLRRVHQTMKGAGEWLQYSVFECDLSDREKQELLLDLGLHINARQDQVLFIDLGPTEGRAASCIASLGRPYVKRERQAVVL
jgi:CRISPR-associated protein Cas2